jgi:hypothetical protein
MIDGHDVLNRYLDDRATGDRASRERIEPGLVETIRRFTAMGHLPAPNPHFADQLEERLMNAGVHAPAITLLTIPVATDDRSRLITIDQGRTVRGARRWLPILVSAALVLLTIGIAWRQFGPDRQRDNPQSGGPAIYAPSSPSPDHATDESFFEITVPADLMPPGEDSIVLAHNSIPAGVTASWAQPNCPGLLLEYVLSGTYSISAEAPFQIARAKGQQEDVPTGSEAVLGPGDTLIIRNEVRFDAVNAGTESVEILDALLGGQASPDAGQSIAVGWNGHQSTQEDDLPDLSQGATIQLARQDLLPDERVTPPEGTVMIAVTLNVTTQSIYLSRDGSFSAGNLTGAPTTTVYTMTVQPADGGAATLDP